MTKTSSLNICLSDKVISPHLPEEYIGCANEGEAIAIAGGWWLGKKERANVYMSGDGFMNALNFITSWVMPEGIEMNIYISTGRQEPPHKVVTDILPSMLELLNYDTNKLKITLIYKDESK